MWMILFSFGVVGKKNKGFPNPPKQQTPEHQNIKLTMEFEKDGTLPFLNVLVNRESDGIGTQSISKTDLHRYLHKESNHHQQQKKEIIKTFVERGRRICEPKFLKDKF